MQKKPKLQRPPPGTRSSWNGRVEIPSNHPTAQRAGGSLERPLTTLCCSFSFRRQSSRVCPWGIDRDLPQHDWHFDCLVATFQREFEFRSNRVIGRAFQERVVRIIAAPSLTGIRTPHHKVPFAYLQQHVTITDA